MAPMNDLWLSGWVQPQHTNTSALDEYRAAFSGSAVHLLILHNFLVGSIADRLGDFLADEASFAMHFAIRRSDATPGDAGDAHKNEELVTESQWSATPPAQRFLRFGVGPGQPTGMSPGWMRYFAFRSVVHDERFARYVESVTGLTLGPVSSFSAHAMQAGDMLAPHNDTNLSRRVAFILYLTRGWNGSHGGVLQVTHLDGAVTRIDPVFNTLVLFEVTSHRSHFVEPITSEAGTARRLSISGWFDDPPGTERPPA